MCLCSRVEKTEILMEGASRCYFALDFPGLVSPFSVSLSCAEQKHILKNAMKAWVMLN